MWWNINDTVAYIEYLSEQLGLLNLYFDKSYPDVFSIEKWEWHPQTGDWSFHSKHTVKTEHEAKETASHWFWL